VAKSIGILKATCFQFKNANLHLSHLHQMLAKAVNQKNISQKLYPKTLELSNKLLKAYGNFDNKKKEYILNIYHKHLPHAMV
jgi:hypothetical protein